MGRDRFASPETTRIELSDGDWIQVKMRLTVAEEARLASAFGVPPAGRPETARERGDRYMHGVVTRILVWVVDWSFRDADDDLVAFNRETVEDLDADTGAEVQRALDTHEAAVRAVATAPNGAQGGHA